MLLKLFKPSLLAFVLCLVLNARAQDIHFSMFYASPLTLNPALTGVNDGTYRVAAIYRNQDATISAPFKTFSTFGASFDIKLLQDKLKNDVFGVGATFVGDQSSDGNLTTNSAMVSAAFHKGLDKDHKHFLGVGVQLVYTNKAVKWGNILFPAQYDASQSSFVLGNGEGTQKPSLNYFDMHAGILQQSTIKDVVSFMTGFSVFHLVQPKESFTGDNTKLATRFVVSEGIRIKAINNLYITPNFIFQYQNKAKEINFGTGIEYHIPTAKSELITSIGGWFRATNTDAGIISAGLEYYKVRAMFAYDITASNLKAANSSRGAFEIALIFTGVIKPKTVNYPIMVPCPMM